MPKRELQGILRSLRRELARVLGDKLQSVILYGSQARGQARSDSDIDVLVVVRDDSDYGDLIRRTSAAVSALSLRYDVVISRAFVSQERYEQEIRKEAGTWFFSRGWTEMGMDFIFHELQLNRLAEKGLDPLKIAHRMLRDFTRGLYIETGLEDDRRLWPKAREISREFNLRLEKISGSLDHLRQVINLALETLEQ